MAHAQDADCWPIIAPHPKPKPNVTPPAFSPVHVYRFRLDRPVSRKSEVTWACDIPAPGVYETVVVLARPPILPPPLKQFERPTFASTETLFEAPPIVGPPPQHFTPVVTGVPEPRSWALFILGFGLIGLMLRRRRGPRARPALID
jgi:hypothetical protein